MVEVNNLSALIGKRLISVSCEEYEFSGGKFQSYDSITLTFSDISIIITPVIDSDEIAIGVGMKGEKKDINAFSTYLGKSLTCVWTGENERGYFDLLILSFEYLHPSLAILSEGSSLKTFSLRQT